VAVNQPITKADQDDDGNDHRTAARRPVERINDTLGRVSTGQSYLRARNHHQHHQADMMVRGHESPPGTAPPPRVLVTCAITIMENGGRYQHAHAVPAAISEAESSGL